MSKVYPARPFRDFKYEILGLIAIYAVLYMDTRKIKVLILLFPVVIVFKILLVYLQNNGIVIDSKDLTITNPLLRNYKFKIAFSAINKVEVVSSGRNSFIKIYENKLINSYTINGLWDEELIEIVNVLKEIGLNANLILK